MSQERKVAIVTGASQGIGASTTTALLAKGFQVVATSRSIQASKVDGLHTVQGDIGSPETAQLVVQEALDRFGRIDLLVNNAGIFLANQMTGYSDEDYAAATSTNLNGFFYTTREALKIMEKQGSGHVVSITTALVAHPQSAVPSALASLTKGGIQAATRALAVEYAGRGIRLNAVAPGVIQTPMHAPETHEFLAGIHPMGRMGTIDEVVDAILYLDDASFVTGEVLHVDGGQSAGH